MPTPTPPLNFLNCHLNRFLNCQGVGLRMEGLPLPTPGPTAGPVSGPRPMEGGNPSIPTRTPRQFKQMFK